MSDPWEAEGVGSEDGWDEESVDGDVEEDTLFEPAELEDDDALDADDE